MLDGTAYDERRARLGAIRTGWYGDAPAVSPNGRRIYKEGGSVEHLSDQNENRQPPPSHEAGRAFLRSLLRDWRTENALLPEWDVEYGGALRRCLVAAGVALRDETDDGRERADHLVRLACRAVTPSGLARLDAGVADLAAVPKAPWRLGWLGPASV
jgi:hypothetical protein